MGVPNGGSVLDFSKSSGGEGIGNRIKAWVLRERFDFKKIVHRQFQASRF